MPMPSADDSTAPFDDETGGDAAAPPEPAPINLTTEQASDAGITDPQPGDTYTLKISIGGTGEGVTGTILPGSAQKDMGAMPARPGGQKIKGPGDLGMDSEFGASPRMP